MQVDRAINRTVTLPGRHNFIAMLCFRLLEKSEPSGPLADMVASLQWGKRHDEFFSVNPSLFRQIPNAPFAYWVSEDIRKLFVNLASFESDGRVARRGPSSGDDFRRIRCFWEINPKDLNNENGWVPFSKGGSYSPFYYDVHLLVAWEKRRQTFVGFMGRPGRMIEKPESLDYFFRPGLTWPRRTQRGLAFRALPSGCAFADKGPATFIKNDDTETLCSLLALTTSKPFRGLVEIQMAFGSYEVGVVQRTVVPDATDPTLPKLAHAAWFTKRKPDTANLTSHAFLIPALTKHTVTLSEAISAHDDLLANTERALTDLQSQIDEIAYRLYGIEDDDREAIERMLTSSKSDDDPESDNPEEDEEVSAADAPSLVSELLDYALGAAFGRWDIRHATGELPKPTEPEPFDPLPVCPPGMLQNADGLPCTPSELPVGYPLTEIPWNGILVDDENHPLDLIARVREVLSVIWPDRSDAIEAEACEILKVRSKPRERLDALRIWFRDPNKFFKDHLARHSKSRRKAPIYWPLSTESGSYTLWIYCHRLDSQTLYSCIEIIDRKREDTGREIEALRGGIGNAGTGEERQKLEDLAAFQSELKTLRDRLLETARLPYRPDLNDGVQITASPLWSCFRLSPWQKILRQTWDELSRKGKYDWSHLAMSIWPERVVPKCAKDRSLAIAHSIEDLFWIPDENGKLRPLQNPTEELKVVYLAGHPLEVIDLAGKDADAAGESGLRAGLWVRDVTGGWRRRKSPHEEIAEEVVRRKGK